MYTAIQKHTHKHTHTHTHTHTVHDAYVTNFLLLFHAVLFICFFIFFVLYSLNGMCLFLLFLQNLDDDATFLKKKLKTVYKLEGVWGSGRGLVAVDRLQDGEEHSTRSQKMYVRISEPHSTSS